MTNLDLIDAATWALEYFVAYDESNAKVHCGQVRYSPITFRLADALSGVVDGPSPAMDKVLSHRGLYEEDRGRE